MTVYEEGQRLLINVNGGPDPSWQPVHEVEESKLKQTLKTKHKAPHRGFPRAKCKLMYSAEMLDPQKQGELRVLKM